MTVTATTAIQVYVNEGNAHVAYVATEAEAKEIVALLGHDVLCYKTIKLPVIETPEMIKARCFETITREGRTNTRLNWDAVRKAR